MNTKLLITVTAFAAATASCDKAPVPAQTQRAEPPARVEAEPFHGQLYRSFDGSTTLTLVSRDELELRDGNGPTLLCKYTKQDNALRVVATALGTTQVIYYRYIDQGLLANNGKILLDPKAYAAAMEQERLREEQQRLAAQAQETERARIAEVRAKSRQQRKVITDFKLKPMTYSGGINSIDALSVTDVSLKAHQPKDSLEEDRTITIDFADINQIAEVRANFGRFLFDVKYYDNRRQRPWSIEVFADSQKEADAIRDACITSHNGWRKQYPEAEALWRAP